MADILRSEEFKATIEKEMGASFIEYPPLPEDLPHNINLDKYGKDAFVVEASIQGIMKFIQAPLIVDKYEDHEEREQKRKDLYRQMGAKYGEDVADEFNRFLTTNKLKRNVTGNILLASIFLFEDEIGHLPQSGQIKGIIDNEVSIRTKTDPKTGKVLSQEDQWAKKSLEEKKAVIQKLTDLSLAALKHIAGK